jgi:hypothetical protein
MKKALLIAAAVTLCAAPGWGADASGEGRQAGEAATGEQTTLSAGAIAKDPTQYYGQSVSVKAEVEDVHHSHVFTLDEDDVMAGPDVLVIAPNTTTVADDKIVTVRGKLRQFVTSDLEKDYKWFDSGTLPPDVTTRFKERPVIIAESIRSESGEELLAAGVMKKKDVDRTTAGDAPADPHQHEKGMHDPQ